MNPNSQTVDLIARLREFAEKQKLSSAIGLCREAADALEQSFGPADYAELLAFKNKILDIAAKRQKGYAERLHGDVLNHECMNEVVQASLDQSRRDIGKPAAQPEAGKDSSKEKP